MSVYVDSEKNAFRGMIMCHMLADTVEELHSMAMRIGMKRSWFQAHVGSYPHYDLSLGRRELAIRYGAIVCDRNEIVVVMKRIGRISEKSVGATAIINMRTGAGVSWASKLQACNYGYYRPRRARARCNSTK